MKHHSGDRNSLECTRGSGGHRFALRASFFSRTPSTSATVRSSLTAQTQEKLLRTFPNCHPSLFFLSRASGQSSSNLGNVVSLTAQEHHRAQGDCELGGVEERSRKSRGRGSIFWRRCSPEWRVCQVGYPEQGPHNHTASSPGATLREPGFWQQNYRLFHIPQMVSRS